LALALAFLLSPLTRSESSWIKSRKGLAVTIDAGLIALCFAIAIYVIINIPRVMIRMQYVDDLYKPDYVFAIIAMLLVMEACKRLLGWSLVIVGVPYLKIMEIAIIPAIIFYISIFAIVDLKAQKDGIVGMKKSELPTFGSIFKRIHLIIPLIVLVSSIIMGSTIMMAAVLQDLGINRLAAHMFIFYFAILSMVTPPIALCAYAAAGIAESNIMRTGV